MRTAAVVLAAGAGSRFVVPDGTHKLLVPFRGRPLVCWSVEHAIDAGFGTVFVVTGSADLSGLLPDAVRVVENDRWREGQATSLERAVQAARRGGFDAIVVGLADQPLVTSQDWRAVGRCDAPIAVATYRGLRRNPVRLARVIWSELAVTGDEGARALMRRRPELVVEVPCPGDPLDVDTVDDLANLT